VISVLRKKHFVATLRQRGSPIERPILLVIPMAKADKASDKEKEIQSIARNKRARHDYHILDTWEAGLVLTGTEVKSLRVGRANITDAYGSIRDGELYLLNLHISPYERGGYTNHEPTRTRKLLLHRKEIRRLIGSVEREGLTLIPLELYFKKGVAKVALALGKGKKLHDKRETERSRDAEREMSRAVRAR
jgi:SsrA-binding protein